MANSFSFKITGMDELQGKLDRLPSEYSRRILRKSLRVPGNIFKKAIQAGALRLTGWMAEHVVVRVKTNNVDEGVVTVTFSKKTRPGKTTKGGTSPIYEALYEEVGTVEFGGVHEQAKPFIRPAFESSKGEATAAFVEDLRDELKIFK